VDEGFRSFNQIENCRRKRRFATEREADDAAYRARMEGRRLGIYQCHICGGWHLTSRGPAGDQ
jgi:hypothetical protein